MIGQASLPIRSVGPDLGQHTREVLSSLLQLSDEEIDRYPPAPPNRQEYQHDRT